MQAENSPPPPPHHFSNGPSLTTACIKNWVRLAAKCIFATNSTVTARGCSIGWKTFNGANQISQDKWTERPYSLPPLLSWPLALLRMLHLGYSAKWKFVLTRSFLFFISTEILCYNQLPKDECIRRGIQKNECFNAKTKEQMKLQCAMACDFCSKSNLYT